MGPMTVADGVWWVALALVAGATRDPVVVLVLVLAFGFRYRVR